MEDSRFARHQKKTILSGVLCFVMILVILQLWLLTATMNAHLGGDQSVLFPAGLARDACVGLNAGVRCYVYALER